MSAFDLPVIAIWLISSIGYGLLFFRASSNRQDVRDNACPSRALRLVTAAALGMGAISLLTFFLGLIGVLNSITAWCVLIPGALIALTHIRPKSEFKIPRVFLLLLPLILLWLYAALIPPGILWGDEPNGYDVSEYHLQIPREWFEAGRITPLHHNVFSYFPQNVEMHYLLAMHLRGGPWAGMYVAQLMTLCMMELVVLSIYAIARDRGYSKQSASLGAIVVALVPWTTLLAPIAYNEAGLLLFGTLAIGWLLRLPLAVSQSKTAVIAGTLTGLACGTKLTAVPLVLLAPLLPLFILHRTRVLKPAILYLLSAILLFSPWLIRNQIWAHNPVFPEAMPLLGHAHFTQTQVERWDRAHHPPPDQSSIPARAEAFVHQVLISPEYGYILIPLAIFAGVRKRQWMLLILLALQLIFWIGFTHLQGRFFTLAVPLCGLLIASLEWRRWNNAIIAVFALTFFMGLAPRIPTLARPFPFLGFDNISLFLYPVDLKQIPPGDRLVLIGDSRAFFYQLPMSRLSYRTVFDVQDDDWSVGAQGIKLIAPSELRRFHRTYFGIPACDDPHEQPYLQQ